MLTRLTVMVGLVAGAGLAPHMAQAQQPGTRRTELQRHDLSVPGREVLQVRVDFDPGVVAPRHKHPGEEIVNVLEGSLEYQIDGNAPVTLQAGDGRSDPHRAERWQRQRRGARHLYRRKGEAAPRAGQVRRHHLDAISAERYGSDRRNHLSKAQPDKAGAAKLRVLASSATPELDATKDPRPPSRLPGAGGFFVLTPVRAWFTPSVPR
jgi:hypothetical protein